MVLEGILKVIQLLCSYLRARFKTQHGIAWDVICADPSHGSQYTAGSFFSPPSLQFYSAKLIQLISMIIDLSQASLYNPIFP